MIFQLKKYLKLLGQSQSTIKIRLMRARREVKKYLEEKDNF